MNIALYCMGGADILDYTDNNLHFVDPYEDINTHWEADVANYNGQSRVVWSALETYSAFLSRHELKRALIHASDETLDFLWRSYSQSCWRPNNDEVSKVRYMAQRTQMGSLTNIDLEFYILEASRFWRAYLQVFNIDIVVSRIVPHSLTDYLLAVSARGLGKSFVCQLPLPTKGTSVLLDLTHSIFLKHTISDIKYKDSISEMIENCKRTKTGIREAYPKSIREDCNKSFYDYKQYLVRGEYCAPKILEDKFRLVTHYDNLVRKKPMPSTWSKAHVFFLQYQPEATSCPLGGSYYDQRTAIQQVYSELEANEIMLVREHPVQFFFCGIEQTWPKHLENILSHRSYSFYDYFLSLDHAYLVPRSLCLDELAGMGNIKVWSLTGTVQLEAYLKGLDVGSLETLSIYSELLKASELCLSERTNYVQHYLEQRTYCTVSTSSSNVQIRCLINMALSTSL